MIRQSLIGLAIVSMVGCQASTSFKPISGTKNEETAQLAAYAATAKLPENAQARDDLRAAAVVDRESGMVRIYNFTDKPLGTGNIWINRTYVQRFDSIPARGFVTLPRAKFYDHNGQSFGTVNSPADHVQLQWDNDVYNLMGPVYQ